MTYEVDSTDADVDVELGDEIDYGDLLWCAECQGGNDNEPMNRCKICDEYFCDDCIEDHETQCAIDNGPFGLGA